MLNKTRKLLYTDHTDSTDTCTCATSAGVIRKKILLLTDFVVYPLPPPSLRVAYSKSAPKFDSPIVAFALTGCFARGGATFFPPKFHAFGICPERDASRGGLRGADFGIMNSFYFEKDITTNSVRTRKNPKNPLNPCTISGPDPAVDEFCQSINTFTLNSIGELLAEIIVRCDHQAKQILQYCQKEQSGYYSRYLMNSHHRGEAQPNHSFLHPSNTGSGWIRL